MSSPCGLLVGLDAWEPDLDLVRYAAMVARTRVFPRAHRGRMVASDLHEGDVVQQLLGAAADIDSDLLLLDDMTFPRGRASRLALRAPCSVWFVPTGSAPVLRRLLVPIDFSARSANSLQTAIDLAASFPLATCIALHVDSQSTRLTRAAASGERVKRFELAFDDFIAGLDTRNVCVKPRFVSCPLLGAAIARAADELRTDLVVMATRGRTGASQLLLPSIVQDVVRQCRSSLLVLKAPGTAPGLIRALGERLAQPSDVQFS